MTAMYSMQIGFRAQRRLVHWRARAMILKEGSPGLVRKDQVLMYCKSLLDLYGLLLCPSGKSGSL